MAAACDLAAGGGAFSRAGAAAPAAIAGITGRNSSEAQEEHAAISDLSHDLYEPRRALREVDAVVLGVTPWGAVRGHTAMANSKAGEVTKYQAALDAWAGTLRAPLRAVASTSASIILC